MTIRVATPEDYDQVLTLAMNFAMASPYQHMVVEETVSNLVKDILNRSVSDAIVLLTDGGMIVGITAPFPYGVVRVATEVAWWVDPDKRNSGLGAELIEAFEYWAEKAGCQTIAMIGLDDQLNKYYEKRGYKLQERVYMKEIN